VTVTADELRALLRAHPAEALEAMADVRIAGPWVDNARVGHARYSDARGGMARSVACVMRCVSRTWISWVDGDYIRSDSGEQIRYGTIAEAQAAADAYLAAEGWVLIDTPTIQETP
jgi:hypothetical protein